MLHVYCADEQGGFGPYLDDYADLLAQDLPSLYHVADTWENCARLQPRLDSQFASWKQTGALLKVIGRPLGVFIHLQVKRHDDGGRSPGKEREGGGRGHGKGEKRPGDVAGRTQIEHKPGRNQPFSPLLRT